MTTARVFLRGGLGNQFFEWLHALTLAESGADVALDTSFLRKVHGNQAAGEVELAKVFIDLLLPLRHTGNLWRVERQFVRAYRLLGWLQTDAALPTCTAPARYQYGYYQHPRHFSDRALQQAREQLRSVGAGPGGLSRYAAVHVRGGDYANSTYNREQIGLLGSAYYRRVLEAIDQNHPGLPCLVVSDDYRRARTLLAPLAPPGRCLFLDQHLDRRETAEEALRALLNADVLACANSSFSALAGYIGQARNVYSPRPWFRGERLASTDPSFRHWHRLDADFVSWV